MRSAAYRVLLSLLAMLAVYESAAASKGDHGASMPGIVVEHAEVIANGSYGNLKGYFSVWNGSSSSIDLISVETNAFVSVAMRETVHDDGVVRLREVEGGLRIPPRSELLMKPDGIQLLFREPLSSVSAGQSLSVTLRFADGSSEQVYAIVHAAETPVTDHHHGESDGSGSD